MHRAAAFAVSLFTVLTLTQWAGRPLPAAAAASPTASWVQTVGGAAPSGSPAPQPYGSPALGDLFGDGRREVVAGFPSGNVHAWFAATGAPLPGWPRSGGGGPVHASVSLADLDGNGRLEVIATSEGGTVSVWYPDGRNYPGWPQNPPTPAPDFLPGFFSSVAVGDLFHDGGRELVASSWDHEIWAWTKNGAVLAGFPINLWDTAWDTPTLIDLEHTGQLDIVVGSDSSAGEPGPANHNGGVYWAFRPDGSQVPGWPHTTDQVPWASTAADVLSGDAVVDVVAGSGHYYPTPAGQQVNVWRQDGSSAAGWAQPTGGRNFGSPAVGDLFGNGGREVVENSEDGTVYAWDAAGHPLPGWPFNANNGALLSSPTIGPVDGSGRNGVWVAAGIHLYGLSGAGQVIVDIYLPNSGIGGAGFCAPLIADLGNGHLSVVVTLQATTGDPAGETHWQAAAFPIPGTGGAAIPAGAWPTFHGSMLRSGTTMPAFSPAPPAPPPPPGSHGYWMVARDGGVFAFGDAPYYGSMGGRRLNQPIVSLAHTADSGGYWMVAADGGIFSFGDAAFHGSTGALRLAQPIVGMAATPSGSGYWLVASDGGIFAFGDAPFLGSMGAHPLARPIVGMTATPSGRGYWMVASDGGIFAFGDAPFYGSMGASRLNAAVIAMAGNGSAGYWMVATDGGVFAFGNAPFFGSMGGHRLNAPINGMASASGGAGYRMVASDGGIFAFGNAPFLGSMGGRPLNQAVVGMTAFG